MCIVYFQIHLDSLNLFVLYAFSQGLKYFFYLVSLKFHYSNIGWMQEGGEKGKEKGPGKEKVKSAKKIQKDMEKWAKMLNQKSKMPINQVPYH